MRRKIRFYTRLIGAFVSKHKIYLLLGLGLALIPFLLFTQYSRYLSYFRPTRHIGLVGRYSLTDLPREIAGLVSIGLTVLDDRGLPGPGLAQKWDVSPDGKTYTFFLKPGLRWQDDSPIYSRDIVYEFRDAVVSYPDNQTIIFQLNQSPYSPLPVLLSRPVFKIARHPWFKFSRLIGTGTYRIKSSSSNGPYLENVSLVPVNLSSPLPPLFFHFYATADQAFSAYKLGTVREIQNLPDQKLFINWPDTKIESRPNYRWFVGLFFNTLNPQFSGPSGKSLRFALAYSIDKSVFPFRAIGPISPDSWAFNSQVKSFDFDRQKALENLKKVEKIPETITISTVPAYADLAESVKQSFITLGIPASVSISPDIPTDFQILLIAQSLPVDPDQYMLWHSTQEGSNLTRLNNPRIDKLLEDGRKISAVSERQKIYSDFQKYLVEEVPVIFLYYPQSFTVSRI